MKKDAVVIIDRNVLSVLRHEFSHMGDNDIPDEILDLEFKLKGRPDRPNFSIRKIIDHHKERLGIVVKYCNMALENEK